jgi:hypothetical protein
MMSDERLARIEDTLQALGAGQAAMRADVDALRGEVGGLRTDLDAHGDAVRRQIGDLRTEVHTAIADLGHQMRVLHEEALDRMQTLASDPEPLRREFRAADADLREDLVQRLEPLEAFVRIATRRRRRTPRA